MSGTETMGQIVGYKRVSSSGQSTSRQELPDVTGPIFEEKLSGANTDRPKLKEMLNYIRLGDEVHVHSIDRLARSIIDLHTIVEDIRRKGAGIKFLKENMHFKPYTGVAAQDKEDPFQSLLFHILGSFAEFERQLITQRRTEGIEKAKADGKYTGRKATIDYDLVHSLLAEYEVSADDVAKWLEVGRASIFRIKKILIAEYGDLLSCEDRMHDLITIKEMQSYFPSNEDGFQQMLAEAWGNFTRYSWRINNREDEDNPNTLSVKEREAVVSQLREYFFDPLTVSAELERLAQVESDARKILFEHCSAEHLFMSRVAYFKAAGLNADEIAARISKPLNVVTALFNTISDDTLGDMRILFPA